MNYCNVNDLVTKFGNDEILSLANGGGGVIDEAVINAALERADAEINRRLRVKGWSVPLSIDSNDLRQLAQDIARYALYNNQVTELVEKNFKNALKTLDDYVKGFIELDIGLPQTADFSVVADVAFTKTDDDRVFTRCTLSGF